MANMPSYFPGSNNFSTSDVQDEAIAKRRQSRLDNRKALMDVLNAQAEQGITMGVDQAATLAKDTLGASAYLNSAAPSRDMLASMTQSYNEKAKKHAEINRRAQFASDEKESTDMSTMASQLFLQGKSPDEVYRAGLDRYGERFNLIQPKLGTINQQATLEGMQKGSEIGKTMFPEDAQSFVEQNKSVLSQAHIDGLTRAAENNLASASNQVLAEADKIGGSGGYTGTEVEGQSFRDRIKTLFPRMPASTIDDLQKKASQAAKAAND